MARPAKPDEVQVALRSPQTVNAGEATIAYLNEVANFAGLSNADQRREAESVDATLDLSDFANNDGIRVNDTADGIMPLKTFTPFNDGGYHLESQMTYPSITEARKELSMSGTQTLETDRLGFRYINSAGSNNNIVYLPEHPSHLPVRMRGCVYLEQTASKIGFNANLNNRVVTNFGAGLQIDTSPLINPRLSFNTAYTGGLSLIFFEIKIQPQGVNETRFEVLTGTFGRSGSDNTFRNAFFPGNAYDSLQLLPDGNLHPNWSGGGAMIGQLFNEPTIRPHFYNTRIYHFDYLAGDIRNQGAI